MPQKRKTPFSGKAKKQQLQSKKHNKNFLVSTSPSSSRPDVTAINFQPQGRGGRNKYALKFYRENDAELKIKKEDALKPINPVPESELEMDPSRYFPQELSFPQRPPWDFNMTPAQLDAQEHRYFTEYISSIEKSDLWSEISYFELNLETWRQLWRVLEMCDVLLLVTDVRFTGCMFPPNLYKYIKDNNKRMILVLNKVDLVPSSAVCAWREYYMERYPELEIVYFTSCPSYNLRGGGGNKDGLQTRRRLGRQRMSLEGATQLYEACHRIVEGEVDLALWKRKIEEEKGESCDSDDDGTVVGETILQAPDTSYYKHEKYKDNILTIGCVGQPNVGKSSLINAVMGKKVVSVSKTPGHTKHFQTIYLTPKVRLCDCPGLVFPSTVPRSVQILMGSYPIAQLREPYSAIRYIAERIDLQRLLRLQHPDNDTEFSPRDLCDAWAKKRGYLTAKAARLDTYRAANSLLRMALDGKIPLWLRPPHYAENKDKFESSEEIQRVKWVQSLSSDIKETAVTYSDQSEAEDSDSSADDCASDSDDSEIANTAMANKFAALAGDDC